MQIIISAAGFVDIPLDPHPDVVDFTPLEGVSTLLDPRESNLAAGSCAPRSECGPCRSKKRVPLFDLRTCGSRQTRTLSDLRKDG